MLAAFHEKEPLAAGLFREAIREKLFRYLPAEIYNGVLASLEAGGKIVADREVVRLAGHKAELSPEEKKVTDTIKALFRDAGVEPPKLDEALTRASNGMPITETRKLFQMILKAGDVVKVTDEMYFAAEVIDRLKASVRGYADMTPDRVIDVPKFKEIAGVSRKYAIPLLEYFDRERVTVRAGDKRVVLK
ncbi:MAG: SelB C-terminal domain-containing protein, partial [Pyrinomonadaceae bacterium]|nr:SelB C-terminal domain-containing protein [Pyrinomonadaceae bacterium]